MVYSVMLLIHVIPTMLNVWVVLFLAAYHGPVVLDFVGVCKTLSSSSHYNVCTVSRSKVGLPLFQFSKAIYAKTCNHLLCKKAPYIITKCYVNALLTAQSVARNPAATRRVTSPCYQHLQYTFLLNYCHPLA